MSPFAKFQRLLITILIATSFFYGGYYYGKRGYEFEIKRNPPTITVINKSPGDQEIDFSLFWDVWDMVSEIYLDRPVDGQKMLYGAISGMVNSLEDPYTAYLPPELNEIIISSLNNSYQGIGAELGLKEGQLIVIAPLDGSPAIKAGVRAGDKILEIEGVSTIGITISEAVAKIRGSAGTVSSLTVGRGSGEPFVIEITRGVITIDSVTWEDKGDGIAYIRVSRFGVDTNKQWDKVVKQVNVDMEELDVIILDVRGNPGGYLQSSVHLAGEFFKGGTVLFQQEATGEYVEYATKRNGTFDRIPQVYVLIDEGSASASEILAAALKENIGAEFIGMTSFGKGTIQEARDFDDGSGVHITTAKWLTPKKEWVHGVGLEPDVTVERTAEDYNEGLDPQLDKAIELAKEI
ncbi:S41 family peptidase [Patescibacteria group bacterium]